MRRVLLLALIWGWSFLFIKVAVRGMTPTTVAGLRVFLGMTVVLVALRLRRQSLPRDWRSWRDFAVMAVVANVLPFTLLAWSEQTITSALTAVLNASTGLFTALASAAFLGERLRRTQQIGLLLGFAGVAVASGLGPSDVTSSAWTGAGAAILASACYGLAFIWAERHLVGIPPLVATAGQLVVATIVTAPFAIATTASRGFELTPTRAASIAILGMVGTGYAYLLNYRSIAALGSTKASLVTYFAVVVAVAVGVVFLDEPFELSLVGGAALVILGVLLVQDRIRRFRRAPVIALVALAALVMGSCAEAEVPEETAGCSPVVEEQLDPRSGFHVLPGSPPPTYASNPPTSGPHAAGPAPPAGVLTEPLAPAVHVQLLERGDVIFGHRDLDQTERRRLERLAGGRVSVVPDPTAPDRVVATAWVRKMLCSGVLEDDLRQFAREWSGRNQPGH